MAAMTAGAPCAAANDGAWLKPAQHVGPGLPRHALANRAFQGISSMAVTPKGRLWATWYAGKTPGEDHNNYVVLSTSGDQGKTWREVLVVDPDGDGPVRTFDPQVWVAPDGKLRLFWAQSVGHAGTVGGVWCLAIRDPESDRPEYGKPVRITDGVMMGKPLVLSSGEWVLPASTWRKTDNSAKFVVSADRGKTWTVRGGCNVPAKHRAFDEHMFVERTDGTIWLLARTKYGIGESVSTDRGKTWPELKPSGIPHPSARFFIARLNSGNLLLVKHGPMNKRTGRSHLKAFVSTDDGKTWGGGLMLDERSGISYPDGQQTADGTIWITYDYSRTGARQILMAAFREEDAAAGKIVTDGVRRRRLISGPPLIPAGWDAKRAGDQVMARLIRVSAPQVKGAHDAEFVCVGERAYIVEHDNDVQPGHGAGRKMYCVLSIVNLKTLMNMEVWETKVEKAIPMARSGQAFQNVTLPAGACFVPRILQLNGQTLRCYFASEDGARREAQTWYRDFDLRSGTFEGSIHTAKIKTVAGVFDMTPRHFHADAAARGFKKPARTFGLYLFDSFKQFDGKTYVAINNWPGKQNALALVHDDFTTFEVIGHFNEPQSQQLSEAAVNRLPDGTWMAICRNDGGNYHFTTSADGRTWSVAKEMPFVPNGTNSKPTFDYFGGVYYLGWQEATRGGGCRRSVFNVDISRDGRTWARKYRFETPESFQYPTFHEHDGVIWLSVSQSDHGGSTDRIMFGKLEDLGAFASQEVPDVAKPTVRDAAEKSTGGNEGFTAHPEAKFAKKTPAEIDAYERDVAAKLKTLSRREICDLALVPPVLNTNPLPEFDYDRLDYGMTIGIARTPQGRIWSCWVAGEDGPGGYFVLNRSEPDGETFSKPMLVINMHKKGLPPRSTLVGNLWTDPSGKLWLFFNQTIGHVDGRDGVWVATCENPDADKPKWSRPRRLCHGFVLCKPSILTNGEWLLPVQFIPTNTFPELKRFRGVNLLVSKDKGATWEWRSTASFPISTWVEPMIVELKDGRLWLLARTSTWVMQRFSSNGGRTWTEPSLPTFRHPRARFFIRRLSSGRILLIKHGATIDETPGESPGYGGKNRSHLTAWLSEDEGKTWRGGLMLDERATVSYPDGFQAPDGTIHISWDRNRAADGEILMARFTEVDILAKAFKGPKSKTKMLISRPLAREVAKLPAFKGPTPGASRAIDMPLVDLSSDKKRHAVVAAGTKSVYQGHCDTVLLPDGKTMFTAWCLGHARWIGPIAKSTDAGLTWSEPLKVPGNWYKTSNTPALHRLVAPDGTARLFCFGGGLDPSRGGKPPYPMHQASSEDNGHTWTPMAPNGVEGEVPPKTIHAFDVGKRLVMWSDLPGYVVQSESLDGGLTWSAGRRILSVPDRWAQPCVVRSADGKVLLMLLRENSRRHQSLFSVSRDGANTWSAPKELPAELTGDRHVAKFAPDGRLVVAFRDRAKSSFTYGHYLAWVGRFEDILKGKAGDYRIKLFHNALRNKSDKPGRGNADCGYSDLELLPDGTIVATTYLKYAEGPEKHSVMNTRFTLAETDALARTTNRAIPGP